VPEKSAKPVGKRATAAAAKTRTTAKTKSRRTRARALDRDDIATRAYYIHLEEGSSNDMENWLRAERELTAA
jgi:hypothetical protein